MGCGRDQQLEQRTSTEPLRLLPTPLPDPRRHDPPGDPRDRAGVRHASVASYEASMMKLWLDDMRPAPPGWYHAYTAQEAQQALLTGTVEECSLDHDLGLGAPDGTELVQWMIDHEVWPETRPRVHSANPAGAARMRAMIDAHGPY